MIFTKTEIRIFTVGFVFILGLQFGSEVTLFIFKRSLNNIINEHLGKILEARIKELGYKCSR